jgi:hypothetical protein
MSRQPYDFSYSFTQMGGDEEIVWKKNEPYDKDSEYDDTTSSFIPNNKEFEGLDPRFKEQVLDIKHSLYEQSILKPQEDTAEAQRIDLMELYETYIKMLYAILKQSQKNKPISSTAISLFPGDTISPIRALVSWISSFYSKNTPRETIPYSHYIDVHLHTNPYYQDDLFISNKNRK